MAKLTESTNWTGSFTITSGRLWNILSIIPSLETLMESVFASCAFTTIEKANPTIKNGNLFMFIKLYFQWCKGIG